MALGILVKSANNAWSGRGKVVEKPLALKISCTEKPYTRKLIEKGFVLTHQELFLRYRVGFCKRNKSTIFSADYFGELLQSHPLLLQVHLQSLLQSQPPRVFNIIGSD